MLCHRASMIPLAESRYLLVSIASGLLVCACQGDARPTDTEATKSMRARLSTPSQTWDTQTTLVPSDGIAQAQFGASVAIDGDTAVIGAPGDGDTSRVADRSGSAYVWFRSGGTWQLQQKLESPNPVAGQQFGSTVSIRGDVALIGAIGDDEHGEFSGAAYIFVRAGTTWSGLPQKLTDANATEPDENFGSSLAIGDDQILIGAPGNYEKGTDAGSAFLFKKQGATWAPASELFASDPLAGAQFGYSVALSTGLAVVGATDADASDPTSVAGQDAGTPSPAMPDTGAVYVFSGDFSGSATKLLSSDYARGDLFGVAVSVSGNTLAVGALSASGGLDASAPPQAGAVYVFSGSSTGWTQQQKLFKPTAAHYDSFGASVALDGDSLFVISPSDADGGSSAFAFTRNQGSWSSGTQIHPPLDLGEDSFAQSLALSGQTALIGTLSELAIGRATVLALPVGSSCSAAGDCIHGNCTEGICCATACEGTCVSCLAARKTSGTSDGTCGPVVAGSDPRNSCAEQTKDSCGLTGLCDGSGSCSKYAAGTVCADASCSTPTTTQSSVCDGSGACNTSPDKDCGSYRCRAGQCLTTCTADSDCEPKSFCSAAHSCELTQPLHCNPNDTAVVGTDGVTLTSCGDYKCVDGACLTSCETKDNCSSGLNCTAEKTCAPKCETAATCTSKQACDPVDHVCTTVCSSAKDCSSGSNCGPVSHQCTAKVDCEVNGDCASGNGCDPTTKLCAKTCATAVACADAKAACDPINHICTLTCSKAIDCKDGLNCGPTHLCTTDTACAQTSDCTGALLCDPVGHTCTESCATPNDCAGGLACDPINNVCTTVCSAAADCNGGLNCSPGSHQCSVETTCGSTSDCASGLACNPNSHECITDEGHSPSPVGCSCSLGRTSSDRNRWAAPLELLAFLGLMVHRRAGRPGTLGQRFLHTKTKA